MRRFGTWLVVVGLVGILVFTVLGRLPGSRRGSIETTGPSWYELSNAERLKALGAGLRDKRD